MCARAHGCPYNPMTAIVNQLDEVAAAGRARITLRPLAGVALASFAALLLELALTRLFSVILFYHFAFLAISLALLDSAPAAFLLTSDAAG